MSTEPRGPRFRRTHPGGKEVVINADDRGRTIDVHALRHTFGTHLSKACAPLRTAQAAMRHSDPSLTANVYADPKLLDVAWGAGRWRACRTCRWRRLTEKV
ncbi:MAG: tyrosine-type recombinase/integrase [Phycisphaerae bacterium]|nr:tyrosine-type recombinase/integrase [Phycisphaerae bacterium]